jgi:hypothetical protein
MRVGSLFAACWCAVAVVVSACKVDDANCTAPSSTWTEVAYLKPPVREVPANFGTTVAMSTDGTTLAVTALSNGFGVNPQISPAGIVFVFQREGARWRYDEAIRPTPTSLEVSFGFSLALSGDGRRLVVTAPFDKPTRPELSDGSALVFDRTPSGWKQTASLKAGPDDGGPLGVSVAISGDGARIALGIERGSEGFGTLRVFDRDSSTGDWKATADVQPPDMGKCDYVCEEHYASAAALSSDGNTLVVGNWGRTIVMRGRAGVPTQGPGSAWVFRLTDGRWQALQRLTSSSPIEGGRFGGTLATSADGRVIAVGASSEDTVHLFRETDLHWTETHRLSTFRWPLVLSSDGSRIMVGEASDPTTAVGTAGSLCAPTDGARNGAVHGFADDGRSFQAFLRPRVHHPNARFGSALAISGDGRTLAVGAPGEDSAALGVDGDPNDHSAPNAGAVYLFQDGPP